VARASEAIRTLADLHALGSVRLALDDTGTLSASVYGYTPFGVPQRGAQD
jgi:EAL domain-containing protein (putative c-di-GMP-specific phosphodiesterase class I)